MTAKRESSIKRGILAALNKLPGVFAYKGHGGPYQHAGIPDISVIKAGTAIYLEVKRPGEEMTPLQSAMARKLSKAGAIVAVVTSVEEAVAIVEGQNGKTRR